MNQQEMSLVYNCDECGGALPVSYYEIIWYDIRYFFCRVGCKHRWRQKKIAHMNIEEAEMR